MKRRTFIKTLILSSGAFWFNASNILATTPVENSIKILMIYNNIGSSNDLVNDWGLSLWVEDNNTAVMFDTGADPTILWGNIETSGVDLQKLSKIVISHNHWDHINGLPIILEKSAKKTNIFVPNVDRENFKSTTPNATITGVTQPVQITKNIWSTGQLMGLFREKPIYEQSIIITQNNASFLFTGCSHPGIIKIVETTKELFPNNNLKLVGGGFHLINSSEDDIRTISKRLKQLHVSYLAPSHCSGELALNIFKDEWGAHFINLNNGDNMNLQTLSGKTFGNPPLTS
jgi:7,8-dihydropterin-6-yl-methyl-4-(beta-D-ribofuranosyl)aminobenzene 5'-phosphate synthase